MYPRGCSLKKVFVHPKKIYAKNPKKKSTKKRKNPEKITKSPNKIQKIQKSLKNLKKNLKKTISDLNLRTPKRRVVNPSYVPSCYYLATYRPALRGMNILHYF